MYFAGNIAWESASDISVNCAGFVWESYLKSIKSCNISLNSKMLNSILFTVKIFKFAFSNNRYIKNMKFNDLLPQ